VAIALGLVILSPSTRLWGQSPVVFPARAIDLVDEARVKNWLETAPRDNAIRFIKTKSDGTKSEKLGWNEWVRKGRAIEGVERRLLTMLKSADRDTKRGIMEALRGVGSKDCMKYLIKMLNEEEPLVQMEIAATLGMFGGPEIVKDLSKALKSKDSNVRANVCSALGSIGGQEASEKLAEASNDESEFVRLCVASAKRLLAEKREAGKESEKPGKGRKEK
jgi:hypothetical protein